MAQTNVQLNIRKAVTTDIPLIQKMADEVSRATYKDIISPEQMDFMMNDYIYAKDIK